MLHKSFCRYSCANSVDFDFFFCYQLLPLYERVNGVFVTVLSRVFMAKKCIVILID